MTQPNGEQGYDLDRLGVDEDRHDASDEAWAFSSERANGLAAADHGAGFADVLGAALMQTVIPKLVSDANSMAMKADPQQRDALLRHARRGDLEAARALCRRCRRGGMRAEAVMSEMLAPVAISLGRFWEEDECDFASVTIGMRVLAAVLDDLRQESPWRSSLDLTGTRSLPNPLRWSRRCLASNTPSGLRLSPNRSSAPAGARSSRSAPPPKPCWTRRGGHMSI